MSQSPVLAGAMVTQGSLIYRANQLGQQTLLGDMMKALSEAQGTKRLLLVLLIRSLLSLYLPCY